MSLNIRLLDRLRAVAGDYVPLGELGPDLEQVRGDLTSLVSFGFGIEQHPYRGASYAGPAERLCPDQIEHELATRWLGRRIAVWNRVTSTNDLAARAGDSRSNDGLVILAEEQTSGRGRRGRSWTAPPRSSILMSVVLFPPPHLMPGDSSGALGRAWLTALGAIATAEVVSAWTGRDASIKWPNDVRVEGRKIAGILVERALAPNPLPASPAARIRAGVGCCDRHRLERQPAARRLSARAGRARDVAPDRAGGARVDRSELARDLIRRLDHWYGLSLTERPRNAQWCMVPAQRASGPPGQGRDAVRGCRRSSGRSRRSLRSDARPNRGPGRTRIRPWGAGRPPLAEGKSFPWPTSAQSNDS